MKKEKMTTCKIWLFQWYNIFFSFGSSASFHGMVATSWKHPRTHKMPILKSSAALHIWEAEIQNISLGSNEWHSLIHSLICHNSPNPAPHYDLLPVPLLMHFWEHHSTRFNDLFSCLCNENAGFSITELCIFYTGPEQSLNTCIYNEQNLK